MSSPNKAIGGYFGLELPQGFQVMYPEAIKYQSARAAFMALLMQISGVKRVWMPNYICDSMLAPVQMAGKEVVFYNINQRLAIAEKLDLKADDLLLYVNYFGVCQRNVIEILKSYNSGQVIIDCSQAFYAGPYDCLATIYSPRKFFGVPDGGLLVTERNIVPPSTKDEQSIFRMEHLLKRLAFSPEAGYACYQAAEASLKNFQPMRMSVLTEKLLSSIDYFVVKNLRHKNFQTVHKRFANSNLIEIDDSCVGAMCYPYLPKNSLDKTKLIKHRIFLPTYWPEVMTRHAAGAVECLLVNNLLALPCDQRYVEQDIDHYVEEIKGELSA